MIDGLIAGKVYGKPVERTSKAGQPFAVAKVRAAAGDGESLFVNAIAFDAGACAALLARHSGGLTRTHRHDRQRPRLF